MRSALALVLVFGSFSTGRAQTDPDALSGIVVDDTAAEYVGEWQAGTSTRPFLGKGYRHDLAAGKGEKSVTFTATVPEDGPYHVLFAYTAGTNRAPKLPIRIETPDGPETVTINQQDRPDFRTGFQPLGEFEFEAAKPVKIVVETTGTSQHVIVDGIRLLTPQEFKDATKAETNPAKPAAVAKKADKKPAPKPQRPDFVRRPFERTVARMDSAKLDARLAATLGKVTDEQLVDDAWFLRRVTQDLVGRQPTLEELRVYAEDDSADRRSRAIDRLLANPEFGRNWGNYWSDVISNRTPVPQLTFLNYDPFEEWLADRFNNGTGWDEIAFDVMTPIGKVGDDPAGTFIGFHQGEPNRIAGETTRVFLGVKIACAQCHDHPFVDMPQEVFHGMAAFFVRAKVKLPWNDSNGIEISSDPKKEHRMPGSKEMMQPTVLSGDAQEMGLSDLARREQLAYWLVSGDNEYFARAHVNRLWARLMGRGFYDPVDDMGESALPEMEELLDELGDHFVASRFDTKAVFRLICNTRAYQRSLRAPEDAASKPFVAAVTKYLRGDEVFDSLEAAVAIPNVTPPPRKSSKAERFPPPPKSTRDLVEEAFGYDPSFPDSWISRTMKQAMFLMNNAQVQAQVNGKLDSGTVLAKLLAAETDDAKVVETLFQRVLARKPNSSERAIVLEHVGSVDDRHTAFEDVLWSLLNSAEFTTRK